MYRVTREIQFCYGHRLLNYDGKCKYMHGHNGRAIIAIEADKLDDRGMVLDFYAAIEQGRLGDASDLRGRIAIAYGIGLITMFGLALLGRNKPRLGEPYGTRSGVQSHASRREDQVGASPSTAP